MFTDSQRVLIAKAEPSIQTKLAELKNKPIQHSQRPTQQHRDQQPQQHRQQQQQQTLPVAASRAIVPSSSHSKKRLATEATSNTSSKPANKLTKSLNNRYFSHGAIPTSYQLVQSTPFGKPNVNQSYISEYRLPQVLLIVYKSEYNLPTEYEPIWRERPLTKKLYDEWQRLKDLDFSELRILDPDWDAQTEISQRMLDMRLACLMHYNLDAASVVRYCGGNFIAAYRQPSTILSNIEGLVPDQVYKDIERILTFGAPAKYNATGTYQELRQYQAYGNHSSLAQHKELALKALNKDDKRQLVLTFPRWISYCIPNYRQAPGGLIRKPGKKDRLIYDTSHQTSPESIPYNMVANKSNEPEIVFATAERRHLQRIYNLRISFPNEEIRLMDDDVTAAFKQIKMNPELVASKGYCIGNICALHVGQSFGDCSSPPNWEPFARGRTALAEHYSASNAKVPGFPEYLDKVVWQPDPEPGTVFIPAVKDKYNPGVFDENGNRLPTQFNMHVDDNLYAEVGRARMIMAMRYSIHSLHQVLGGDDPATRPRLVDMDKFLREGLGHRRTQLGSTIDTRRLRMDMTDERRQGILKLLKSTWGPRRRSFTISEAATLLGIMMDASRSCRWGIFLFIELQQTLLRMLRKNHQRLLATESYRQLIESLGDTTVIATPSKYRWFSQKVGQAMWASKAATFFNHDLRQEIEFVTKSFEENQSVRWSSPIALLIKREPSYTAWGDACLEGAGGFSLELKFWWALEWPEDIRLRTLNQLEKGDRSLISINLLEYATVVIGLAATIVAWEETPDPKPMHPLMQIFTDNTTAESWTKRIAGLNTVQARALARLLCHLLMLTPDLGLSAEYLDGKLNGTADYLSRLRKQLGPNTPLNFSTLIQKYPSLRTCRRFRPSQEFLCLLYSSLSTGSANIPTTRVPLGHLDLEEPII